MEKGFYLEYYKLERTHWWFKVREKILQDRVAEMLKEKKGKPLILNIGVATGMTSEMLRKYGNVKSVEYDRDCYLFTREKTNLDLINASITDLPFDNDIFDLVCAFDVLEHVSDDKKAVSEMYRVCKQGGMVFVTVPAFKSLWSNHDILHHHFRRYNLRGVKKLFLNFPGEFVRFTYFNFFLFLPIFLIRKIKLFSGLTKRPVSDYNLFKSKAWLNKLFYRIFFIERPILKVLNFPFGVSIMAVFVKSKKAG